MIEADYPLSTTIDGTDYKFAVKERNREDEFYFAVMVLEPEDFHIYQELEMPLIMRYNAATGSLKFDSVQVLSAYEHLETYLSAEIQSRYV